MSKNIRVFSFWDEDELGKIAYLAFFTTYLGIVIKGYLANYKVFKMLKQLYKVKKLFLYYKFLRFLRKIVIL
jgi:hypothetical protein